LGSSRYSIIPALLLVHEVEDDETEEEGSAVEGAMNNTIVSKNRFMQIRNVEVRILKIKKLSKS